MTELAHVCIVLTLLAILQMLRALHNAPRHDEGDW